MDVLVRVQAATFLSDTRRPEVDFLYSWVLILKKSIRQIVSVRVKTFGHTDLVASRHLTSEKGSLPVDVRRSKTWLHKLPNCFSLSLVTVPEVFAKVNSAQFPSFSFLKWRIYVEFKNQEFEGGGGGVRNLLKYFIVAGRVNTESQLVDRLPFPSFEQQSLSAF